jgi:hypothetical protein
LLSVKEICYVGVTMKSSGVLAACVFLLGSILAGHSGLAQEAAQETTKQLSPEKAQAAAWSAQVTGRHYFLKEVRDPYLINDQVDVTRCDVRYHEDDDLETGVKNFYYRAKLWFQGVSPGPSEEFRITVEEFKTLEEMEAHLEEQFSPTPLEDAYDWPPEIKLAVRYRYIALGMDSKMVALALGGLPYQVDLEQLDDKRVRETWKLEVSGDTRRIFENRSTHMNSVTSKTSESYGTIDTFAHAFAPFMAAAHSTSSSSGASVSKTTTAVQQSGFFVFSGLPPQFLHIVFTDGKVTARRTEFVK